MELKSEKAPELDDFIGKFFKTYWDVIKDDLIRAVQYFYNMYGQHFNLLNSPPIVLIPKSPEAKRVTDFRPISLTSSIAKIISKCLSNKLSSCLNLLVSRNQRVFIRRSIQDNFLYAQNLIRELHRAQRLALFLKLDIAKAFDTVRWNYLIEVLHGVWSKVERMDNNTSCHSNITSAG